MNKKNNRKGFTTVELVIVIAVIAILAAVLIPTFSNLISKANESSRDQTAAAARTAILNESLMPDGAIEIGENDKVYIVVRYNGEDYAYELVNNKLEDEPGDVVFTAAVNQTPNNLKIGNADIGEVDVVTQTEIVDLPDGVTVYVDRAA